MDGTDPRALSILSDVARRAPIVEAFDVPILDLVQADTPYWGELPQEALQEVLRQDDVEGAFDQQVRSLGLSQLSDYALDIGRRTAWAAIFGDLYSPHERHDVALDIGAGFGANTLFLAERFETVVATDIVLERLAFIGRRARARGLANVLLVRAQFECVPLRPAVVDLAVCNGVLEWVGAMDEQGDPQERQVALLRAIALSLKPKGRLYIGIENRFGLPMWRGVPDHSGLPFTSLVPRRVANAVVRIASAVRTRKARVGHYTPQCAYRTYTHTPGAWRALLVSAGMQHVRVFGADDYNRTRFAFPMGGAHSTRALRVVRSEAARPRWLNNMLASATCRLPGALLIHASPRATDGVEERVRGWLEGLGVRGEGRLQLVDVRSADGMVVRYVVWLEGLGCGGGLWVLSRMGVGYGVGRSFRRVRVVVGSGEAVEGRAEVVELGGEGYFLLEPLREPPSLLWELRHGGVGVGAWVGGMARDVLGPLLVHVSREERRWTGADTARLIGSVGEGFMEVELLKEAARGLEGSTLRFGEAHGDLAPENLFREGDAIVVDDWNEVVADAPVAMDAVFFAATSAWSLSDDPSQLVGALASLRPALTPDEFSHRGQLLALSLLHWRTLRIGREEEWARARVAAALKLLGVSSRR